VFNLEIWRGLKPSQDVSCLLFVLADPAELVVDGVWAGVEAGRVLARQRVQGERAHQGRLVEDGLVWAEEAPLEHLLLAVGVRHRVADVEHLAIIVYICVVAVAQTVTSKCVNQVLPDVPGS